MARIGSYRMDFSSCYEMDASPSPEEWMETPIRLTIHEQMFTGLISAIIKGALWDNGQRPQDAANKQSCTRCP